ncbi:DUF4240 domain-containing protein [Kitasatospora sp. NPDC004289]
MEIDEFWQIVETARRQPGPVDEALVGELTKRSPEEVVAFQGHLDRLREAVYRWDVWAAAYLLHGGCSDDGFMDFRAGLITLGRDWYERAAASPDALADHPVVLADAPDADCDDFFQEGVLYAPAEAWTRLTGERDSFYRAAARPAATTPPDMGEDFDFDDDAEMARRLPRLAALYL